MFVLSLILAELVQERKPTKEAGTLADSSKRIHVLLAAEEQMSPEARRECTPDAGKEPKSSPALLSGLLVYSIMAPMLLFYGPVKRIAS